MRKISCLVSVIAVVIAVSCASNAHASLQTGDIVRIGNGPGSPGGVFYLQDAGGNHITNTFCVQIEEFINFADTYQVADGMSLQTAGVGSRPLTSFAAWLFDRFLNGTEGMGPVLSNFDFSNTHGQVDYNAARFQANEVQLAIWRAMNYLPAEIGGVSNGGWYDTYDNKLAGWEAEWQSDVDGGLWTGTGDIYVVTLLAADSSGEYTIHAQDQLIRIPSDNVIPEPLSAVVWSALLALVGGAIHRRRGEFLPGVQID
jgi:hypothetical protein